MLPRILWGAGICLAVIAIAFGASIDWRDEGGPRIPPPDFDPEPALIPSDVVSLVRETYRDRAALGLRRGRPCLEEDVERENGFWRCGSYLVDDDTGTVSFAP